VQIKKNYFLSSWTENFGVVPLFLLRVFLLAPCFFSLFALLFFVTRVLETIESLRANLKSRLFLYSFRTVVKASMSKAVFLLCFFPHLAMAIDTTNLMLSKGEQKELKIGGVKKFSVGSPEIISYKHYPQKEIILIKGMKVGFTDLMLWGSDGKKQSFQIFVLSKQGHLKLASLQNALESLNLKTEYLGKTLLASGEITSLSQYSILKTLEKQFKEIVHFDVSLQLEFRNNIIGEIYAKLFEEGVSGISCKDEGIQIICQYSDQSSLPKPLENYLTSKYFLKLISRADINLKSNYRIRFKIIQTESSVQNELSLGLDHVFDSVTDIFYGKFSTILSTRKILMAHQGINLSVLAEPEVIVRPGVKSIIELGSNVSFSTSKKIFWKFAGLRVEVLVKPQGNFFLLNYQTEFTRPSENSISGSKQQSSTVIDLKKPLKLFQIRYLVQGQQKSGLPYLYEIPILGKMFQSDSDHESSKSIIGFFTMEPL